MSLHLEDPAVQSDMTRGDGVVPLPGHHSTRWIGNTIYYERMPSSTQFQSKGPASMVVHTRLWPTANASIDWLSLYPPN
eukprot:scaffold34639_cov206-Amphora_coffeaeformis.AAC.3